VAGPAGRRRRQRGEHVVLVLEPRRRFGVARELHHDLLGDAPVPATAAHDARGPDAALAEEAVRHAADEHPLAGRPGVLELAVVGVKGSPEAGGVYEVGESEDRAPAIRAAGRAALGLRRQRPPAPGAGQSDAGHAPDATRLPPPTDVGHGQFVR